MRILAIETVGQTGSVSALFDGEQLAEQQLDPTRRSAQTLVPGIAQLLDRVGWQPFDVELVCAATGPGSFTGLRIGVTTAKTFAFATGCRALGVHSMLAIGWRVSSEIAQFSVAIDAQRNELFVAELSRGVDGMLAGAESTRIVPAESWLGEMAAGTWVTGPGLVKWRNRLKPDVRATDPALWSPTATSVGEIGWRLHNAGVRMNHLELSPQYFRRTAAEEQWERKRADSVEAK